MTKQNGFCSSLRRQTETRKRQTGIDTMASPTVCEYKCPLSRWHLVRHKIRWTFIIPVTAQIHKIKDTNKSDKILWNKKWIKHPLPLHECVWMALGKVLYKCCPFTMNHSLGWGKALNYIVKMSSASNKPHSIFRHAWLALYQETWSDSLLQIHSTSRKVMDSELWGDCHYLTLGCIDHQQAWQ